MEKRKPLIIAEKPSAARAIAEALGGFQRGTHFMESDQYLLSWAIGHLVELLEPEDYNPRWRRWSLESLPILPERFQLKVVSRTAAQFKVLQKLASRASSLINACDAGREGELIFRFITEAMGVQLPVKRLWVSSLTPEAIRAGFQDLRPAGEYERLYQSALCRAQGDWLVGMNGTRAFTTAFGELLSVGRVQTPTLALLVRREQEIRNFKPEPFWEVVAEFRTEDASRYRGKWHGPEGDRIAEAAQAEAIRARVAAAGRGQVASVTAKEVAEKPPQLYDLTSLQREANRRFGLTAAATLKAAQSLYEQKLITYPRTDSRYLSRDVARQIQRPLTALARLEPFRPLVAGADPGRIWSGRVVNDARVTDHHAIIPTGEAIPQLTGVEARVFELIARRFQAQLYPEARFRDVEVWTLVGSEDRFRSRGRTLLEPGWQVADPPPGGGSRGKQGTTAGESAGRGHSSRRGQPAGGQAAPVPPEADGEEATPLPPLASGEPVTVAGVESLAKETQPPRRYTEAQLLGAMEAAGKEIDDEALREAMKGRGLGTPATRAAIIERLKQVGYIEARGKVLQPTAKGERLVALAQAAQAQLLLSAELTGEWEKRIADIQAGGYDPEQLRREMRALAIEVVEHVRFAALTGAARDLPPAAGGAGPGTKNGKGAPASGRRSSGARVGSGREGRRSGTATGRGRGRVAAAIVSGESLPGLENPTGDGAEAKDSPPAAASGQPAREQPRPGPGTQEGIRAGSCPRCGGEVVKERGDWRCRGKGCRLRIPGELCGRSIPLEEAGQILREGRSPLLDGFISRRGQPFSAYLVLGPDGVSFEFPSSSSGRRQAGRKRR